MRMAKKKGPGRPEPEVLQGHKRIVSFVDGMAYALSGLYGISHYTALARELMFRNVPRPGRGAVFICSSTELGPSLTLTGTTTPSMADNLP